MNSILAQQKVITRKVLQPIDHFTITICKHGLKPTPPLGPMIGQRGINIVGFIQETKRLTAPFAPDVELRIKVSVYPGKKYAIRRVDINKRFLLKKIQNSFCSKEIKQFLTKNAESLIFS